jgi:ABC-type uncharacterized transport system substrate-binding protein
MTLSLSDSRSRILVLHSYADDYIWTHEVNIGIQRILGSNRQVEVRYHYLDARRRGDAEFLSRAAKLAINDITEFRPQVLIAIDDIAQDLVVRHFVDAPNLQIVFGGVGERIEKYGFDKAANVTGIMERKPFAAIKEIVMILANSGSLPPAPRIAMITDTTASTMNDAKELGARDWKPGGFVGHKAVDTFEDWQKAVLDLKDKADVMLVSGYRRLKPMDGKPGYVRPAEIAAWTEANSPVPIIGVNSFNSEDGFMLSIGVSPFEQGEVTAKNALVLLQGKLRGKDIPVADSQQYVIAMRESAIKRRNVTIPKVLEAFARATNNYLD